MALKFTDGCSTKVKFQFGIAMHGRMSHKRYILNPTTLRIITVVEFKFLWHDVHKNGKGFCPTLLSRILFSLKRSNFSRFECSYEHIDFMNILKYFEKISTHKLLFCETYVCANNKLV